MTYFRSRNKLKNDYSGYQEASSGLRSRLIAVCTRYSANEHNIGLGQEDLWVWSIKLGHELKMNLNKSDIHNIIALDSYDFVFEAIEIYLHIAKETALRRYSQYILPDIQRAFELSGSVYFVSDEGIVCLSTDEKSAKNIKDAVVVLKENKSAQELFKEAVGDLFGRKRKPEDIVSDIFIAFEDYLKKELLQKSYGDCVSALERSKLINGTQKSLLEKLYAYRSDVYGAAHAGNSPSPKEIDAIWYLETVVSQIKYLSRKLHNK